MVHEHLYNGIRSLSATVDGKRIGDSLLEIQGLNIENDFTEFERAYR